MNINLTFKCVQMEYVENKKYYETDTEVIKTFYARDNNLHIVNFVLQADPNLALDLSTLYIGFTVDIPKNQLPDNGFASKMFKNMNIEVNSQLITSTKSL